MKLTTLAMLTAALMAGSAMATSTHTMSSTGTTTGTVSNGATPMIDNMNSNEEAMDNDHKEYDNKQGVKPYTRSMSKNDYDSKNKTKNKGQSNVQPETHEGR